jgi:hypothetical protein
VKAVTNFIIQVHCRSRPFLTRAGDLCIIVVGGDSRNRCFGATDWRSARQRSAGASWLRSHSKLR